MKKFFLIFAAAAFTASVSAQTVTESKLTDNIYVGVNGGVATKTTQHSWLGDLCPNAGIRVGRYITPVLGVAVEGNAYFSNKPYESIGTVVRFVDTHALGTVNLSNLFGGYKGEPRCFEVSAVYGLGWRHIFGAGEKHICDNQMTSKAGVDFALNLGKAKAWQIYVEPAMVSALTRNETTQEFNNKAQYNIDRSMFQVNAGVIYKFKNSNGTHNFTIAQLRDQAEIDGLNSKSNDLRNDLNGKDAQLAAKDRQIADLQKALDECNKKPKYVKPATATNLQPTVLFRQGKSVVNKAQYAPIELIAQYMKNHADAKVEIKGYASPEGPADLNQKLSEERAAAVKDILVKKYKIAADRLTTKGCGVTDKLFEQVEFNRVATFNDNSK